MTNTLEPPTDSAFRPWAIVPAKTLSRAKSRLDCELGAVRRRQLASTLLERVLRACSRCRELEGTLVATDGDDVERIAMGAGALVVRDGSTDRATLGGIVDDALAASEALGATHGLVLMADLPLLEVRDVSELVSQLRQCSFLIAPDAQRRGTSALGVQFGLGARTWFGHADSLQRHTREALRVGAQLRVYSNPRVSRDLDTVDDLERVASYRPPVFTARSRR